ncbi:MAG: HAMP domain-containing histidine kinase [Acidobacteria bacterium]|nr:HAMP domain-containing histidine kinase [Acidobacteriota bacterium]
MRPRDRKARTRIVVTGTLATFAVLAAFAIAARIATRVLMLADLDDELETLSIAIASDLELRGTATVAHESLRHGVETNAFVYRLEHHAAVLFDAHGVLAATGELGHLARHSNLLEFQRRDEQPFTGREPFTGQQRLCRFRVTHLREHAAGATLLIFRSIETISRTLDIVDGALALLVFGGSLASALILRYAVGRALLPVEQVTAFAERITASDLAQRVEVAAAGEEFQRLADVINSLLERLDRSFDAQRRLVADAAHELKTPAAVIAAEAQELARGRLSEDESQESLRMIARAAAGLAHEVDDLLELARGDAAQRRQWETFDVDEALDESVAMAVSPARERGVIIMRDGRAACRVHGDRAGFVRAIGNLVANAVRYGPRDSEVRATARVTEHACEIDVADRGPGIPEAERARIFERFVRLSSARKEHPEGAGLGLAIVEQIVQAHGGAIEVLDREGGGALFRVRFPRAATEPPQEPVVA